MRNVRLAVAAIVSVFLLGSCSHNMSREEERRLTGQVVGGVTGAAVGSLFGGGTGRIVATGAGAVIGSIVGGNLADR
jgi:uncharacterized protein YcfJ